MIDIPPEVPTYAIKVAPAAGGALTAAIFTKGNFLFRFSMFVVGVMAAFFASELAGKFGDVSSSTAAYLVGVFSPFTINKALVAWENLDISAYFGRWLPKKDEK